MPLLPKMWTRNTDLGKCYYVTIGGKQTNLGRNRREAKAAYDALMQKHGIRARPQDRVKLHAMVNQYLEWIKKNRAETTYAGRFYRLNKLAEHFGNYDACDLTPTKLESYCEKVLRGSGKKHPSPTTVNVTINAVHTLYEWGVKRDLVDVNPFRRMDKPACLMRETFLTPKQFNELLGHLDNKPEVWDTVVFLHDALARVQEIFKIEAKYVHGLDEDVPRVVFPAAKSKKGRTRQRCLFVGTPWAVEILRRLTKLWPKGPIFRDARGIPWSKDTLGAEFDLLKDAMGIKGLCATVIRHSAAHARLVAGQSFEVVAKLMGHSSTAMVFSRYGHIDKSDMLAEQAAAFKVDRQAPPRPAAPAGAAASSPG